MGRKNTDNKRTARRDARKQAAKDRARRGGGGVGQIFVFPEGSDISFFESSRKMELDIIAYEVTKEGHPDQKNGIPDIGDLWDKRPYGIHRNIGPEEKTYVCPKMTFGLPCPICEEIVTLSKNYNDNKELIRQIKVSYRTLFNVIDLDEENKGVQLWNVSNFLFTDLLDEEIEEGNDELADYAELEGGFTLKVRMKDSDFKTSKGDPVPKTSRIDFAERDDYEKDILKATLSLDDILNVLSYNKLRNIYLGLEDEKPPEEKTEKEDWNKDKEEKKESRSSKRGSRQHSGEDNEDKKEEGKNEGRKSRRSKKTKDEDKEEEKEETRSDRRRGSSDDKCPSGGRFGKDCDTIDECDECGIWEKCRDAKDEEGSNK